LFLQNDFGVGAKDSGLIPAGGTIETMSLVVETKVSEANCRFLRIVFGIHVS
jgi:hypothetical protein